MFCPKCGNQLADGAKFCGACGAAMSASSQSGVTQAEQAKAQPQQAYQQPAQQQTQAYQQPAQQQTQAYQQPYQAQAQQQTQAYQQPQQTYQQPYQAQPQQSYSAPPHAAQAAGAATAVAKKGFPTAAIIGIIAAVVVVAAIIVFVVFKPIGGMAATPQEAFNKTYSSITSSGTFKESIDMNVDVSAAGYTVGIGIDMDVDVSGYDPNNPSNTKMTGSGTIDLSSVGYGNIPFTIDYANGMMTLDMGSLGSQTQAVDLSELVTTDKNYEGLWQYATMSGNTITFDLSNVNLSDLMANGVLNATGTGFSDLQNFSFDTMTYTVTLDDAAGKINADLELVGSYSESGVSYDMNMSMKYVISK